MLKQQNKRNYGDNMKINIHTDEANLYKKK